MNYLDIILAVLVVVFTYLSARKGLFHVISQYAATIAAFLLARLLSLPAAEFIYSHYVSEQILGKLTELLPNGSVSGQIDAVAETAVASLPEMAQRLIAQFRLTELLHAGASQTDVLTVSEIETLYVAPIVTKALSILTLLAIFLLFSIILKTAVYFLNRLLFKDRQSKLQGVNKFFGALFGVARGVFAVFVLAVILNIAASFAEGTGFQSVVSTSYVCNYVSTLL